MAGPPEGRATSRQAFRLGGCPLYEDETVPEGCHGRDEGQEVEMSISDEPKTNNNRYVAHLMNAAVDRAVTGQPWTTAGRAARLSKVQRVQGMSRTTSPVEPHRRITIKAGPCSTPGDPAAGMTRPQEQGFVTPASVATSQPRFGLAVPLPFRPCLSAKLYLIAKCQPCCPCSLPRQSI